MTQQTAEDEQAAMTRKEFIDAAQLRELISYDCGTGELRWKPRPESMFSNNGNGTKANMDTWNKRFAGKLALASNLNGYKRGCVFGEYLMAHRVAWAIHYGHWPKEFIDHISGDRGDNRIVNLRSVSKVGNAKNCQIRKDNTSGVIGVSWSKKYGAWKAAISINGRNTHLGYYEQMKDAVASRKVAEFNNDYHPNHGRAPL